MKRLPVIITVLLILAVTSSYFFYTNFFNRPSIQPWDIIPEETILVYESGSCASCLAQTKTTAVFNIIERAAFYSKPVDSLSQIRALISNRVPTLISLHSTRKDDFDFLFYRSLDTELTTTLKAIIQSAGTRTDIKYSTREFNSKKIQEVSAGKTIFSWTIIENVWVGSFTPFLIEDVIRTYESGKEATFRNTIADVYQLPKMRNDAGNIYIHLPHFSKWISVFTSTSSSAMLNKLGNSAVLDLKIDKNSFSLNGFTSDSTAKSNATLEIFNQQAPVPFQLKQLISNRAVMFVSYGISNGKEFKKSLTNYSQRQKQNFQDTLKKVEKELSITLNPLYESIRGEIGISYQESKGQNLSKVLLVQTTDRQNWLKSLNEISQKLSVDTVFFERFSSYEIRELPLHRFPEKFFWPLLSGFTSTYYTFIDETILMAEDLEELKRFLEDIDKEDTWGKSVSQNHFLESTLLEANISVYVNTPKVWNVLSKSLHPRWNKFVLENQKLLRSLQMGAIQLSHLNESFYTNVTWWYGDYKEQDKIQERNKEIITNFGNTIRKAFVVRSHVSRAEEVLIQDSSYNISLVSASGNVLWKVSLGQPIIGNVHQVDFLKNGKLQFLISTPSALHVIDRLGNEVDPYPIAIKIKDADKVSLIDYDHSKNYRFLITSKHGKLWMYDKDGRNLEGWQPKNVEGSVLVSPQHHRIRGKDYIVALRADGMVYLLNRRGELIKNFPLNLGTKLAGDYFLETGSTMADTYFVVVSRDGFKIKFNLEGKVLSRETLIKTSMDAKFSLISEKNKKTYIVLRQENKQLTVFDEIGKEIIKSDFVGINPIQVNYYDFGAGKTYVTITDLLQDLSFIYDGQGNLLTPVPLESNWIDIRIAEEDRVMIFTVIDETLRIQRLP